MKHLCTQNDLVRYLYNETSPSEDEAIEEKMSRNWNYKASFEDLRSASLSLSGMKYSPDSKTINRILNFCRNGLREPQLSR